MHYNNLSEVNLQIREGQGEWQNLFAAVERVYDKLLCGRIRLIFFLAL